jgi:hypothetical protein
MQTIVIYPGRFHPFHRGHYASYKWLTDRFGADSVFVATSDKQDPETSPFSFADKQFMMNKMGIPAGHVVKVKNPYQAQEIIQNFDPEDTVLIFAISDKDAERISFKPKRDGSPSYLQPFPDDAKKLLPMKQHGYAILTPRVDFKVQGRDADSASQIRALYAKGNDAARDNIIADLYGDVDGNLRKIFDVRLAPKSESNEFVYEDQDYLEEKQDACYHKVRSRYKVWPSAYASGALVQCRKKGAKNWGNKTTEQMLETMQRMRKLIAARKQSMAHNNIDETSRRDQLAQRHQDIRKKSGLPNPDYYKELQGTFDLPDAQRQAAVTALRKKHKVKEQSSGTPNTVSDAEQKLARLQQMFDPDYEYSDDHSVWKKHNAIRQEITQLKSLIAALKAKIAEDSIDDRLAMQHNTPQAKSKSQAIDQAFTSGQQAKFDKLGIMSPQQIERDYQAMRDKEPAQDAAVLANPKLTPGARAIKEHRVVPASMKSSVFKAMWKVDNQ